MDVLKDIEARNSFNFELNKNFSVLAPAGVGKTTAVVNRIISLIKSENAKENLRNLVVVTYTNKAAEEFKNRCLEAIETNNILLSGEIEDSFNKIFFGTTHSFCLNLVSEYGYFLGIGANVNLPQNPDELWEEFIGIFNFNNSSLDQSVIETLFRFVSSDKFFNFSKNLPLTYNKPRANFDFPNFNLDPILDFPNPKNNKFIQKGIEIAKNWLAIFEIENSFCPIPEYFKGGKEFSEVFQSCFIDLKKWLNKASFNVAYEIKEKFQEYSINQSLLNYDDQVLSALKLVQDKEIEKIFLKKNYKIILDEAQDTDPNQFKVLLTLAQDKDKDNFEGHDFNLPKDGSFCMVGDPMQSIYSERANLSFLNLVRKEIVRASGEEICFSVTFRCASEIINFVNSKFERLFNGKNNQVKYEQLNLKPEGIKGQVLSLNIQKDEQSTLNEMEQEADFISKWITINKQKVFTQNKTLAILSPRVDWLKPIYKSLKKNGLKVNLQSNRLKNRENPSYAWLLALVHIVIFPDDENEIYGVLREVFAIKDSEFAEYIHFKNRLKLVLKHENNNGIVGQQLNFLKEIREESLTLNLYDSLLFIIEKTLLKEKLNAIQKYYPENNLLDDLEQFLNQALEMEANGFDLEDYFKKLTLEKNDLQNKTILKENSIDLFSCHKAKGLEWDTVILPFLNKKIFPPSFNYPVIVSEKGDVAIDKSSREPFKESLDKKRNNEIERLLYVALTRGKNNLILINDKDLFNCKHSSFFNVLNSVNNGFINLLPENLEEDKKFKLNEIINNKEILEYKFPNKIKNSIIHPVKILPSKIKSEKIEILKELEEKPIDYKNFKDDGAIYGDWFHNLLENLPWKKPLNTWQTHFNNYIKLSPDKNRSTIEWEIFINSKFILKLINESFDFYPELPVFYPLENGDIMEGFIDLAIKTKNEWIIIDWKTDRYVLKDPSTLIKKYKFQINAYKKALNSITKITCRGFLYSSVMGKSFEI